MTKTPTIAIFDIGKTNKKLLLFDEQYNVVFEQSIQLPETTDEDGFPCEDITLLTQWVKDSFNAVLQMPAFTLKAVNFSGYGASFVYINKEGKIIAPLYNYLKSYPPNLQEQFYTTYGGESLFAKQTASPVLGSLNSGMQVYRLKQEQPALFAQVAFALHLPQYISYILSDYPATDITSIGCHTNLWNFQNKCYHEWLAKEKILPAFAPIMPATTAVPFTNKGNQYIAGIGLHDSSAALIPYLASFSEPFILLSTGTWSISFNPFNHETLSDVELHQDCLCYMSYMGNPIKASRLFAGHEHEEQVKRLAAHFNKPYNYFTTVVCDQQILSRLQQKKNTVMQSAGSAQVASSAFAKRDLQLFNTYEAAYHQLIADIMLLQVHATKLVLASTKVKRIFVDGGFSKNPIYMHLLAKAFPRIAVYAATVAQASALGAAMVLHEHWNTKALPDNLIQLQQYP
jgi:sugar (pentulose or hexulose) kinase